MSKRYTYAESNYSPIHVYNQAGDRKRGSTIARPIAPDWNRGKVPFHNKEVYVSLESFSAREYVSKIENYYSSEHTEDWPELENANEFLQENPEMPVAEAVVEALQTGENPLDALKKEVEKERKKLEGVLK